MIKKILTGSVLWLILAMFTGCGYSLSPTPYGLLEAMTVSVPVAENQTHHSDLAPLLTSDVISRLDSSSNIKVREGAPAQLKMRITNVVVSGGSWDVISNYDIPENSASRVVSVSVEAVLERPNPDGDQPLVRRHAFGSSRTFWVNNNLSLVELRETEAFNWVISDLSQKIAQTMFSEF